MNGSTYIFNKCIIHKSLRFVIIVIIHDHLYLFVRDIISFAKLRIFLDIQLFLSYFFLLLVFLMFIKSCDLFSKIGTLYLGNLLIINILNIDTYLLRRDVKIRATSRFLFVFLFPGFK